VFIPAAPRPRRLLEVHERKCVIGHGLFDGEGHCTAVLKAIMVSLTRNPIAACRSDPVVRAALEKFAASKDGLQHDAKLSRRLPRARRQRRLRRPDRAALVQGEGERLRVGLPLEARHGNPMGWAHGGLLVTVADMVMGASSAT